MEAQCADDWERLAKDEIEAARIMLAARKWKQAYQHGGIAIECALKCRIMRHLRLNRWPDRRERRDLWTHDLEDLFAFVINEDEVSQYLMQESPPSHICAWVIVKDWHIEMRYHNPAQGRFMLNRSLSIRSYIIPCCALATLMLIIAQDTLLKNPTLQITTQTLNLPHLSIYLVAAGTEAYLLTQLTRCILHRPEEKISHPRQNG